MFLKHVGCGCSCVHLVLVPFKSIQRHRCCAKWKPKRKIENAATQKLFFLTHLVVVEPWTTLDNPGTLVEPWTTLDNPGTLEHPGALEPWNPGSLETCNPDTLQGCIMLYSRWF